MWNRFKFCSNACTDEDLQKRQGTLQEDTQTNYAELLQDMASAARRLTPAEYYAAGVCGGPMEQRTA